MAVPSGPAPSAGDSESKKVSCGVQTEVQMKDGSESEIQKLEDPKQWDSELMKSAGGKREYENGKTCHQCRQKILVFAVGCKNMKKDKQCTMKFCVKCLRNRYGELAEDMETLVDWKCPKCRGICNCSQCMKRKGLKPTGILVHAAKKTGYSSVLELLDAKGPEACQQLTVKKKRSASAQVPLSSNRQGENFLSGTLDANLDSLALASRAVDRSANNANLEGLMEDADSQEVGEEREKMDDDECIDPGVKKKVQKNKPKIKPQKLDASMNNHVGDVVLPPGTLVTSVSGIDLLPEDVGCALQFMEFCATFEEVFDIRKGQPESVLRDIMSERGRRKGKYSSAVQFLVQLLSFILKGEEESLSLNSDSDKDSWIDYLKKCICESDCVLEDIPKDCFDQGHDGYEMLESSQKLKLLTFLCDEALCTIEMRSWIDEQHLKLEEKWKETKKVVQAANKKEKWLKHELKNQAEKEVIAQNEDQATKEVSTQNVDQAAEEVTAQYEDQAAKEVIAQNEDQAAKELIAQIEDQAAKEVIEQNDDQAVKEISAQNGHQAVNKVIAQNDDEVAKEVISQKRDFQVNTSENDSVVAELKAEVKQASEETLKAIDLQPKKRKSDALGTEPIFFDNKGRVYWRLKCLSDADLLLQDIGDPSCQLRSNEKWFSYNAEETKVIENHISFLSYKRGRLDKLSDALMTENSSSDVEPYSSSNNDTPPTVNNNN